MGIPAPKGVAASGLPPATDQANAVVTGSFGAIGASQPFPIYGAFNAVLWGSVSTALTTTAGSTSASVVSGTGIAIGQTINSVNVPRGTTWLTFSGTSGTLAIPAITLTGTINPVTTSVTGIQDTTGLVGATVAGDGIPASTTVLAITTASVAGNNVIPTQPGTITLSNQPTKNATGPLTFARTGNAITISGADANALFQSVSFAGTVQLERSFDGGQNFIICGVGGAGAGAIYVGATQAGTPVSIVGYEPERSVLYRWNCVAFSSGVINYRLSATGLMAVSAGVGGIG